jgi:hypothetical protein
MTLRTSISGAEKKICEAFGCYAKATTVIKVKVGQRGIISLLLCQECLDYRREDAFNFYSSLFFLDRDIVNFRTFGSTSNKRVFSNIITVNYDLVIEDVFDRMDTGIHRGLIQHSPEEDSYIPLELENLVVYLSNSSLFLSLGVCPQPES